MQIKSEFDTCTEAESYLAARGWKLAGPPWHWVNDNLPGQTREAKRFGRVWVIDTHSTVTGMTAQETAALHRQGICPMD
jgi:hypothetical protein